MKKIFLVFAFGLLCFVNIFAQNGGKAEPNRIKFAKGKFIAIVSDKIYGDLQGEYIFTANEGQKVTVKITSVPKGKFSAFKVLNAVDQPEFVSEYDSNYDYTFTAPYSGDYLIWVHFKPAGNVKSAKYSLTLSIK